jgi:DNA polymerase-1
MRLLAHIAGIPQLKAAFAEGQDIHAMTASEMFGVPVEGMPADVRRRAKAINFGIIYGISAFGLANQLGISREDAGAYIKKYFERFPGIRAYMDQTKLFVRENGYVTTFSAANAIIRALWHQILRSALLTSAPRSMRRSRVLLPTSSAAR